MHTGQVGGSVGPFLDPASGQQVTGTANGSYAFEYAGDPNAVLQHLQAGILRAATAVIQQKLAANQVALPTLSHSMPHFVPEIVAQSGAQQMGVQITQLTLNVTAQSPAMVAPPAMGAMPPTPMQAMQNSFKQQAQERLDPNNYEVRAQVNVGGFKIKGSTDGGLDTEGLKNQVVDKAKSTIIWWAIGCVIIGLVILGLVGLAGYIFYVARASTAGPATTSAGAETADWDGKSTFTCGAGDNKRIKGVTAKLASGTAIKAIGSCRLEIVDCTIEAPKGIDAMGTAIIVVKGGSVTSSELAANAMGTATITFEGTKVTGKTKTLGAGAKITGN